MPQTDPPLLFQLFNEISIIEQLSRSFLSQELPQGLTVPHFFVLNYLSRAGDGATPMTLAQAFQVPKTSLTHTLSGLETRGLVSVRRNPRDGRSKQVWLTQAGRDVRARVIAGLAPKFQTLARGLDVDHLADALPILQSLRQFMETHRPKR